MIAAHPVQFLLILVSLILMVMAGINVPAGRLQLGWLGVALLASVLMLGPFLTQ